MQIRCLVLDDEELAINFLLGYIAKVPFLNVIGSFTDPFKALAFLESNPVDLVFLDVEMPNYAIDGLDFINLASGKPGYIFTTAYPSYALDSYDYNAIDFLRKPISFERFSKAVQKARTLFGLPTEELTGDTYTYLKIEGKYQRLDFDAICWIESDRNYVSIFTEQDRINLKMSLGELEGQLPKRLFVRIHKSYIVAWKKIDQIDAHQLVVRRRALTKELPLGDTYRKAVLDLVGQMAIRKK